MLMSYLFIIFNIAVFTIGLLMINKHYKNGWDKPPVLSGIAFVLIALPSILSIVF